MSQVQFEQTVQAEQEWLETKGKTMKVSEKNVKPTGLALLREPFPPHQISKLPKPTKAQTDAVRADYKAGERCVICGTWHHPKVIHLDYVGHAALTDRLLDADPQWNWEYVAVDSNGNPVFDNDGGMWIRLTVCGVTRLGYGDAQEKTGGNATKERIGDALRNAAMRFGAALDLWHKGDLHIEEENGNEDVDSAPKVSNKSVPVDVWESLTNEEREFLQGIAMDVIALLDEGLTIEAVKLVDSKRLDADEKVALWSRFNSGQRSAMRKSKLPTAEELINTI